MLFRSVGASLSFPLVAMRGLLESALTESRSPHGFLTGAVTFCEAMPMRSIPFRVVVLLGMDEREFPRSGARHGFDLMAQEPRVGDRSLRDDDRYLFLEALLAARDALVVTYTGQSVRDNAPLPPSVVVSELLDACAESFDLGSSDAGTDAGGADERVDRPRRSSSASRRSMRAGLHSSRYHQGATIPTPTRWSPAACC